MQEIGRFLLLIAAVLALVGASLLGLGRLGLGKLPGDLVIRRPHLAIYIPLASCLLLSLLLTVLLRLFRR